MDQFILFYRCVICGRKSSDSVKIGGGTIATSGKKTPDLFVNMCFCNKCDEKIRTGSFKKLEDLYKEFIKLCGEN